MSESNSRAIKHLKKKNGSPRLSAGLPAKPVNSGRAEGSPPSGSPSGSKNSKLPNFLSQDFSDLIMLSKWAVIKTLISVLAALFFFVLKTEF